MDSEQRARQLDSSPLGWMLGDPTASGRVSRARRAAADERRFLQPSDPRPTPTRERWRLIVHGVVQGVGYRASCHRQAIALGLSGWVRNRPDGSVEVEAEGTPQRLTELQLWCEKGPGAAQVRSVASATIPPTGEDWFEVRR